MQFPTIIFPKSPVVAGTLIVGIAIVLMSAIATHSPSAQDAKNTPTTQFVDQKPAATDADNDGAPDWEEKLFGTDSTKADTDGDGISDAEAIALKKRELAGDVTPIQTQQNLTKTEAVAQNLIGTFIARNELGVYEPKDNEKIIAGALEQTKKILFSQYTKENIGKITKDLSDARATQYRDDIKMIMEPLTTMGNEDELQIYAQATEKNDPAEFQKLTQYAKVYADIAERLMDVETPSDALTQHIALANAFSYLSASVNGMSKGQDDIIGSYAAVGHMGKADEELRAAYLAYETYFLVKHVKSL